MEIPFTLKKNAKWFEGPFDFGQLKPKPLTCQCAPNTGRGLDFSTTDFGLEMLAFMAPQ